MIEISPFLSLDDQELEFSFIRSSGPGGQNVNKVATAVQLRYDVLHSASLPGAIKTRLVQLAGSRMTEDGILTIEAKRYRSQEQNRADAIQRLISLIKQASIQPEVRKPTRPTRSARAARVDAKKMHGLIKQNRSKKPQDWE